MEQSLNVKKAEKKILVTGSNGFVGLNLVRYLCQTTFYKISAMVLPGTPIELLNELEKAYQEQIEIVYADILKDESLNNVTRNIDVIIHLAGLVTDWAPKEKFNKIIVQGTENLLNSASINGVSRIIYMSSLAVHDLNGHNYDNEEAPRDMEFFAYGVAKREAEDLVSEWGNTKNNRDSAIVRPGWIIFGEHDISSFILALDGIIKGKFGFIDGGKALISYVYVENLAYGINLLISAERVGGPYIILDGNKTWKDWVECWSDAAGTKMPKLNTPYWLIYPPVALLEGIFKLFRSKKSPILNKYRIRIPWKDLAFVNKKIKDELGYDPPIGLEESIEKTLDYYKTQYIQQE